MTRSPTDFGDYFAGHPPDARLAKVLTYDEWLARRRRRDRLRTLAGYVAAMVVAGLLAWAALGVAVAR